MGDVADMMLDGTLCSSCGQFLGAEDDYPQMCPECLKEDIASGPKVRRSPCEPRQKVSCAICKRRVNILGIKDHMRDKHKEA